MLHIIIILCPAMSDRNLGNPASIIFIKDNCCENKLDKIQTIAAIISTTTAPDCICLQRIAMITAVF